MSVYDSEDGRAAPGFGLGARGEPLLRPPPQSAATFGMPARTLEVEPRPTADPELAAARDPLPVVDLRSFPIDRSAAQLLPPEVARFYTALPYGFEAGVALVALADETETTMLSLRLALGRAARFARASRIELAAAISAAYAESGRPALAEPVRAAVAADTRFRVLVRLHDAEPVDAGLFDGAEEARARAVELADQLECDGTWPFVHGRFLRPEAVASVDVVEETAR